MGRERERERGRSVKKGEPEHASAPFCSPGLESRPLLCQNEKPSSERNSSTTRTLCAISDLQTQTVSSSPSSLLRSSTNAQISSSPVSTRTTQESPSNSPSMLPLAAGELPGPPERRVAFFAFYQELANSYRPIPGPQLISPSTRPLFSKKQNRP